MKKIAVLGAGAVGSYVIWGFLNVMISVWVLLQRVKEPTD